MSCDDDGNNHNYSMIIWCRRCWFSLTIYCQL